MRALTSSSSVAAWISSESSGLSMTRIPVTFPSASNANGLGEHRPRGAQGGGVGRVAQERLADALAEDPRLAARSAHDRPLLLGPVAPPAAQGQAARAAVERELEPGRGPHRHAGEARDAHGVHRLERDGDVVAAGVELAVLGAV